MNQESRPNPQGVERDKIDPKDNGKNKAIMSEKSPYPLNKISPWDPNKVLPNDPSPHFPILGPYNVIEYLTKVLTHIALVYSLRTPTKIENLSCVLQDPPS